MTRSVKEQASIGLGFIAPSLTTYTGYYPSFTIIDIDEEFMIPIAYKTYYFNITQANLGEPKWELHHNFA